MDPSHQNRILNNWSGKDWAAVIPLVNLFIAVDTFVQPWMTTEKTYLIGKKRFTIPPPSVQQSLIKAIYQATLLPAILISIAKAINNLYDYVIAQKFDKALAAKNYQDIAYYIIHCDMTPPPPDTIFGGTTRLQTYFDCFEKAKLSEEEKNTLLVKIEQALDAEITTYGQIIANARIMESLGDLFLKTGPQENQEKGYQWYMKAVEEYWGLIKTEFKKKDCNYSMICQVFLPEYMTCSEKLAKANKTLSPLYHIVSASGHDKGILLTHCLLKIPEDERDFVLQLGAILINDKMGFYEIVRIINKIQKIPESLRNLLSQAPLKEMIQDKTIAIDDILDVNATGIEKIGLEVIKSNDKEKAYEWLNKFIDACFTFVNICYKFTDYNKIAMNYMTCALSLNKLCKTLNKPATVETLLLIESIIEGLDSELQFSYFKHWLFDDEGNLLSKEMLKNAAVLIDNKMSYIDRIAIYSLIKKTPDSLRNLLFQDTIKEMMNQDAAFKKEVLDGDASAIIEKMGTYLIAKKSKKQALQWINQVTEECFYLPDQSIEIHRFRLNYVNAALSLSELCKKELNTTAESPSFLLFFKPLLEGLNSSDIKDLLYSLFALRSPPTTPDKKILQKVDSLIDKTMSRDQRHAIHVLVKGMPLDMPLKEGCEGVLQYAGAFEKEWKKLEEGVKKYHNQEIGNAFYNCFCLSLFLKNTNTTEKYKPFLQLASFIQETNIACINDLNKLPFKERNEKIGLILRHLLSTPDNKRDQFLKLIGLLSKDKIASGRIIIIIPLLRLLPLEVIKKSISLIENDNSLKGMHPTQFFEQLLAKDDILSVVHKYLLKEIERLRLDDPSQAQSLSNLIWNYRDMLRLKEGDPLEKDVLAIICSTTTKLKDAHVIYNKLREERTKTPSVNKPEQTIAGTTVFYNPSVAMERIKTVNKDFKFGELPQAIRDTNYDTLKNLLDPFLTSLKDNPKAKKIKKHIVQISDDLFTYKVRDELKKILIALFNDLSAKAYLQKTSGLKTTDKNYEDPTNNDYIDIIKRGLFEDPIKKTIETLLPGEMGTMNDLIDESIKDIFDSLVKNLQHSDFKVWLDTKGKDDAIAPKVVARLKAIVKYISAQSNQVQEGLLISPLVEMLFLNSSSIANCDEGKEKGIHKTYRLIPEEYRYELTLSPLDESDESRRKRGFEYIDGFMQTVLINKIDDDSLIKKMLNITKVGEGVHQSNYVGRMIANDIGLDMPLSYDRDTGVLYDDLIDKSHAEILQAFYDHLKPQEIVKLLKNDFHLSDNQKKLAGDLSSIIDKTKKATMFDWNETFTKCELSDTGALDLLITAGYLQATTTQ